MKGKKIGFQETDYQRYLDLENKAVDLFNELMRLAEVCLGIDKVESIKDFLEAPALYIVDSYWTLYCQEMPEHLSKTQTFTSQTGFNLKNFDVLINEFNSTMKSLGNHALKVTNKGIARTIQKDSFNVYLSENKTGHYNALDGVLKALKELEKYQPIQNKINFIRSLQSLKWEGLEIAIDENKFKD